MTYNCISALSTEGPSKIIMPREVYTQYKNKIQTLAVGRLTTPLDREHSAINQKKIASTARYLDTDENARGGAVAQSAR
jgi:hypothetical protein